MADAPIAAGGVELVTVSVCHCSDHSCDRAVVIAWVFESLVLRVGMCIRDQVFDFVFRGAIEKGAAEIECSCHVYIDCYLGRTCLYWSIG